MRLFLHLMDFGYYYFHEENLEGILARLGNIYGVSFRIQSDKLKERRFTGTFYRGAKHQRHFGHN